MNFEFAVLFLLYFISRISAAISPKYPTWSVILAFIAWVTRKDLWMRSKLTRIKGHAFSGLWRLGYSATDFIRASQTPDWIPLPAGLHLQWLKLTTRCRMHWGQYNLRRCSENRRDKSACCRYAPFCSCCFASDWPVLCALGWLTWYTCGAIIRQGVSQWWHSHAYV